MKWLKPLLLVIALGQIVVGLYFFYAVDVAAQLLGFDLLNTGSRGELRALAGGLVVSIGIMILRGTIGGQFGRQWLYAAGIVYSGLFVGRIVSLGMDGLAAHTVFAGLFETVMAVLLFWAGAEVGRSTVRAPEVLDPEAPSDRVAMSVSSEPSVAAGPSSGSMLEVDDDVTSDGNVEPARDHSSESAGSGE